MKRIVFCSVIMFLIPTLTFAQAKNDTKVIVTVSDTTNLTKRLTMAFYESGYTFEDKDESVGFFVTKPKELPRFSVAHQIKAFIKDNTVTLSGLHNLGLVRKLDYSIAFNKRGKNFDGEAWEMLEAVAKKIEGQITYAK